MGHPTLRELAKPMSHEEILSAETEELLKDMIDTMEAEGGIGIAAPQIGVSKQMTIIAIDPEQTRYPEAESTPLMVIFNPKITILDHELQGFWEGCLSVPGLKGYVQRPKKVRIEYLDQHAKPTTIEVEGFLATVFQHELDHLFGALYIDKISDITKLAYNEEFEEHWMMNEELN
jgi:peptide deformylase